MEPDERHIDPDWLEAQEEAEAHLTARDEPPFPSPDDPGPDAEEVLANVEELRSDYLDWRKYRIALSEQEASGDYPDPDDWAASDDSAVDLLDSIAFQLGWMAPE